MSLTNLHDATLLSLAIDWHKRELCCTFSVFPEATVRLIARSLTLLKAPRNEPWGPSVSVNEVRTVKLDAMTLLSIEMQSGDVIEVCAQDVTLEPPDSSAPAPNPHKK